jgi:hypothetical protein
MQRRGESGQPVKGQRMRGPKAREAPTAVVSANDYRSESSMTVRK